MRRQLELLRSVMKDRAVDFFIITGSDPHHSEYPPERWCSREWISGFTGSAGTVVVTMDSAGLWTDARYHIQAAGELEGSGITLFKSGLPGVPEYQEWIRDKAGAGDVVGSDGSVTTVEEKTRLESVLEGTGAEYRACRDLLDAVWTDRPPLPESKIFQLDIKYSGRDRRSKIDAVREEMARAGVSWYLVSSLSDVAWITNLRGSDIDYNPLFLSFILIGTEEVYLFADPKGISSSLKDLLVSDGIILKPYGSVSEVVSSLKPESVLLSPESTSVEVYGFFRDGWRIVLKPEITAGMKAVKNEVELSGIKKAMVKDGTALVKFFYRLETSWQDDPVDEYTLAERLEGFRALQENFMGPSFGTIAGFRDHGAVVHYSADPDTAYPLDGPGLLLLDSGGQYLEGTTDITRVVAPGGGVTGEMKEDYTLVLKGHVDLAAARFPKGTTGIQLDTIARLHLWRKGKNYLHGTGHGVGHFLSVHEGPVSINPRQPSVSLKEGMVLSDEPGYYREGMYGIRIENLVAVRRCEEKDFEDYLCFETLTLFPYERDLMDTGMLSRDQIEWIDRYHEKVFTLLSPYLEPEEKEWLRMKTEKLG